MAQAIARFPGQAAIDAYGNGGFRFAGMSHRGSLLCLPSGIYAWDISSAGELSLELVGPLLAKAEGLSLLLLGTGGTVVMPDAKIAQGFREAGVGLEVMDTGAACRTYNVLLAEGRSIGAALIAVE